MAEEGSGSVHRAAAILAALGSREAANRPSLGVVEIARIVGREKTQISRALKVLHETGLVERDPETLGYRLGWRLFTLAANAGDQHLLAAAPVALRRLVSTVRESAHLNVLQGPAVLTVVSESPLRAVQALGWVGHTTPVHCTSSGRALLFDYSEHEIRDLLGTAPLSANGPKAPRDVDAVLARLRRARARDYALADDELEPGLVAAAAPVRDFHGRVVAAVSVSAPKFRVGRGLESLGRRVKGTADELSSALGDAASTADDHSNPSRNTERKPPSGRVSPPQ